MDNLTASFHTLSPTNLFNTTHAISGFPSTAV